MKRDQIKLGMRVTYLKRGKPRLMVVEAFRHIRRDNGKLAPRIFVRSPRGGPAVPVLPAQLHGPELYDEMTYRMAVEAEERERIEKARAEVFSLLIRRRIVPREAVVSDDGKVFDLSFDTAKLERLAKLLRYGIDGKAEQGTDGTAAL